MNEFLIPNWVIAKNTRFQDQHQHTSNRIPGDVSSVHCGETSFDFTFNWISIQFNSIHSIPLKCTKILQWLRVPSVRSIPMAKSDGRKFRSDWGRISRPGTGGWKREPVLVSFSLPPPFLLSLSLSFFASFSLFLPFLSFSLSLSSSSFFLQLNYSHFSPEHEHHSSGMIQVLILRF